MVFILGKDELSCAEVNPSMLFVEFYTSMVEFGVVYLLEQMTSDEMKLYL